MKMTPKEEREILIKNRDRINFYNFEIKQNQKVEQTEKEIISKAIDYYLEMNGMTKEEIRAKRDMEIIENLSYVDNDSWGEALGVKKVLDWIKENK